MSGGPEGFDEAIAGMREMKKAVQRGIARTVLRAPARLLADAVRQNAPEFQGNLKAAVKVVSSKARRRRGSTSAVELAVLVDDPAAVPNEYSNVHIDPAQPFFRPAIDANLEAIKAAIIAGIKPAIEAAAKRAAARGGR